MFNLFKKKDFTVSAAADGELLPLTEVKDEVFSTKMLGDGFAIKPADGKIYAPIAGKITTVFPTKHAIGITAKNNLEILVHLGIDTVELKGKPFNVLVQEGDSVKQGAPLAEMDTAAITGANYDDTVIIVYTNMDIIDSVSPISPGKVEHGQEIQTIKFKS